MRTSAAEAEFCDEVGDRIYPSLVKFGLPDTLYWRLRMGVLLQYGGACECCGVDHPAFLSIVQAAGEKAETKNITQWLIANKFPAGFKVLCHNCRAATSSGFECPHKGGARKDAEERAEARKQTIDRLLVKAYGKKLGTKIVEGLQRDEVAWRGEHSDG